MDPPRHSSQLDLPFKAWVLHKLAENPRIFPTDFVNGTPRLNSLIYRFKTGNPDRVPNRIVNGGPSVPHRFKANRYENASFLHQ